MEEYIVISSVVVGCDAIDPGPDWVRLHTPGGSIRTIAWSSISMAAVPPDDPNMIFEGDDMGQITALRATHDPLWIEAGEDMAIVLLEKNNPKRASILSTFQERLESRWLGDRLRSEDAAMRLFKMPGRSGGGSIPRLVIFAIAGMLFLFVFVLALVLVRRH
jgi:hypothetical protein